MANWQLARQLMDREHCPQCGCLMWLSRRMAGREITFIAKCNKPGCKMKFKKKVKAR